MYKEINFRVSSLEVRFDTILVEEILLFLFELRGPFGKTRSTLEFSLTNLLDVDLRKSGQLNYQLSGQEDIQRRVPVLIWVSEVSSVRRVRYLHLLIAKYANLPN